MSRVRQTIQLSAARFLGMAISFLSVPFFLNWLGAGQLGAFYFVQAMGRYAAMIDSGFAIGANRLMTRAHAEGNADGFWRTWATSLRICLGVGLLGAVITLAFGFLMPVSGLAPGVHPLQLFAAAAVGFLAETLANAVRTALTSRQQFTSLAAIQGGAQLFGALLALGAVYWTRHPAALFVGPAAVSVSLAVLCWSAVRNEAMRDSEDPGSDGVIRASLWSFVVKAYPNHALGIIAGSTDRVLVEKALGAGQVAQYAIASRIPEVISLLLQPIQDTAQPILSRAHHEGEARFAQETTRLVRMALAIGLALILVPCAFSEPLLKLWLGRHFDPTLVAVMVGIAAFRAIEHLNVTVLLAFIAAGNPGLANPTSLFNAVAVAGLTFPAAYYYGLDGVAWVKVAIQIQALILLWVLFRKVLVGVALGPQIRAMGSLLLIGGGMAWLGWEVALSPFVRQYPVLALGLAPTWAAATFGLMAALKLTPIPGPLARLAPFLKGNEVDTEEPI